MAEETQEKSLERRIAHDVNNKLIPILGYSEDLSTDPRLKEYLPPDVYASLVADLQAINQAGKIILGLTAMLSGFYRAKEQGAEPVEASKLGEDKAEYRIVHIDDDPKIRIAVYNTLKEGSNILPQEAGVFGHDGRRVRYEIISYGNVTQALREIPTLESIDLLLTDREMSEVSGYDILNAINQLDNRKVRRPEFQKVRNVAMLTGGITEQEATDVMQTYNIPVLTKPFRPLNLEQQIYRIINPQPVSQPPQS